jgi:tetratricopeptide (TPR) repeat protein
MHLIQIVYLCFLFAFTYLSCKEKSGLIEKPEAVKAEYLSEAWVKKKLIEVDADIAKQKIARQKSEELLQKGISLYKSKKDAEAIILYEAANDSYPTGENYYHFGNSLANLDRLKDSIEAYKISLLLKPKRPELASYNIACAYSRLGDVHEAYSYLADSIDMGYNAFAHIEKDPDMKNLRAQPDWKEKINGLILSSKYTEEDLYGRLTDHRFLIYYTTYYYLCRSKEILIISFVDSDCNEYSKLVGYWRGRWRLENGKISINQYSQCYPHYILDSDAKESPKHKSCVNYKKKPVYKECKNVSFEDEISKFDLKTMIQENELEKLSPEQEPKQCDPNFVPKTLEDLYVK